MKFIVGVDEVGRGPLAGPVTVCVVCCTAEVYKKLKGNKNLPARGKDSKKLKNIDREIYHRELVAFSKQNKISFSINHISNTIIDKKGISYSINKAISLGFKKLNLNPEVCRVLLDGGLKAPTKFNNQKTIIKGDEKEKIISWASILAKVERDDLMSKASKKYPMYGLEKHKGYGTSAHRQAIGLYGASLFHRKSFCKNSLK